MNLRVLFFCVFIFCVFAYDDLYSIIAVLTTSFLVTQLINKSSSLFAFREWALLLYAVNYLLSPSITYQLDQTTLMYPMKISSSEYFEIALPGFFCFYLGMYVFNSRIFKPSLAKISSDAGKNESLLRKFVIIGLIMSQLRAFVPGELAFFVYLISLLRFVGAFVLFSLNTRKYWMWTVCILIIELYKGALIGMYHDAIMWILFFALYFTYTVKPAFGLKILGVSLILVFILLVQAVKVNYRDQIRQDKTAGLGLVLSTTADVSDEINSESNLLGSLNRGNQAWIFASAKERMDRIRDYQGLHILGIYMEAALLPRFLAPDKITSGDKKIFNTFSGHTINENTSMGLGVFADGYIAYGNWGVIFFTFGLGLLFSVTFLIIESWAKLSEFYVLMVLPLLNYAIRPDCELQTIINHLVKGLIVFGILVTLTKFNFVMSGSSNAKVKRSVMPLVE